MEVLAPVEGATLRKEVRLFLDAQLDDHRSAWEMRSDGSYEQRVPETPDERGAQEQMIEWANERYREATRLKRRQVVTFQEVDISQDPNASRTSSAEVLHSRRGLAQPRSGI